MASESTPKDAAIPPHEQSSSAMNVQARIESVGQHISRKKWLVGLGIAAALSLLGSFAAAQTPAAADSATGSVPASPPAQVELQLVRPPGVEQSGVPDTITLKDATGKFHGLWKPDLRSLDREPGKNIMPSFKDTLTAEQLDDLVAYLLTLKGAQ